MFKYKIYFLVSFLVLTFYASSQNTTSPYSIFGPGEIQQKGFGKIQGMGGAGIALQSGTFLNNLNPASYSGIDSLHYIYSAGLEAKLSNFRQKNDSRNDMTANFKYFALGFRIDKLWAASIGLTPYTNVGYDISSASFVEGTNSQYLSTYVGSGGISQAYIANAFKFGNLSLGINTSYMFGSVIQEETLTEQVISPNSVYTIIRTDYLKSFYFDYGLQYSFKIEDVNYAFGATFSQKQSLDSRHVVTVLEGTSAIASEEEELDYIEVPNMIGVGFAVQNGEKYTIAADYQFQQWSDVVYPTQLESFVDAHNFSFGAEFRPWPMRVVNKGYQNWVYRAGLNYGTSYLKVGGQVLDEKSISLGIGVPIKNEKARNVGSALNFAVEVGTKGSSSGRQVKENYVQFHMNFSINEIWFMKRKYF